MKLELIHDIPIPKTEYHHHRRIWSFLEREITAQVYDPVYQVCWLILAVFPE